MEWLVGQQMVCLLQSVLLGMIQGLLLDGITGFVRIPHGRRWLWTDVLFGPLAAVITFLGALIIRDGQLHPLLMAGVLLGMVFEHLTIGVWVCGAVRRIRKGVRALCGTVCVIAGSFWQKIRFLLCSIVRFRKNDKKM